ncbi:MAG: Ppx/GppA family phosphatase [Pseudooceanicola sp.]|nr:Ppx/GppA family phosphatase [Pseudooceanicola sp.]
MNQLPEHSAPDWGPFGRPLFEDPASRALSKVGVVDIGSNSVRLVVFDGAARSPAYFYNEKIMCALGAGVAETGKLNPEGRVRALAALHRFQLLAEGMGLPRLTAVATAAVRDASDGPAFRQEVLEKTGLPIWVIDGEEEARLSAQGVLLGWPGAYGLVCDLGGSSMELAEIREGKIGKRLSTSDLGPLKLKTLAGGARKRGEHIRTVMEKLSERMGPQHDRLFLVGGSWRAIAKIDMERRKYPLKVLHEYRMSHAAVRETLAFIAENSLDTIKAQTGLSNARLELVPFAAEILGRLVRQFRPLDIAISSYGIREGLLYEQMSQRQRDRDPLIEACRFAEAKDARLPGFGRILHDFVLPLFPAATVAQKRLIKAACLLHDVSWRAHPDYRAEVCFDNATRANLGGLKHSERVFLGLALLHRYSNKRAGTPFEALYDLLDAKGQQMAEVLGKAMRFGAMLWMQNTDLMGHFEWNPRRKRLMLAMPEQAMPLYGEVAQSRLASLAQAMGASVTIRKLS